jgi:adenylosuccinate synthase
MNGLARPLTRAISIQDIGFGDSGKGLFVDALVRQLNARAVVRFNGGSQAGHNVIENLPNGNTRHHTFSQLGSGSFLPLVKTVLLHPFVLHPSALLYEVKALHEKGVSDLLPRLYIDQRCRVTTPFHQAAGRLREKLRADHAHGSCGVGFGETVLHSLEHASEVICYGDLHHLDQAQLLEKLEQIRITLSNEILVCVREAPNGGWAFNDIEWSYLCDHSLALRWLNDVAPLIVRCKAYSQDALVDKLSKDEWIVFEGAQGVLLDEWNGFHPHTTWSAISTAAVDVAALYLGIKEPVFHVGVMRSYLTRHGQGPFPSECAKLNSLKECHNVSDGWQGQFRYGQPDALMLNYAVRVVGQLNALAVSHLDVFDQGIELSWVRSYRSRQSEQIIDSIPLPKEHDLAHQNQTTRLLESILPVFDGTSSKKASVFLEQVQAISRLPVWLTSCGPTAEDVDMSQLLAQL